MEQAIFDTTFDELKKAAKWLVDELKLIETYNQKLTDLNQLQQIKVLATTPDLDQLDKLMRYQTTLQRQLSTAMGELLAITGS